MPTCDDIEVALSSPSLSIELKTTPCFDVEVLQSDITIEALSLANQGPPGQAATLAVGTTATTAPGAPATVANSGTSSAAVFDFSIPRGQAGPPGTPGSQGPACTVAVGTTTTGAPGSNASVVNTGTPSDAVLNFSVPQGPVGVQGSAGAAATITAGTTATGAAGTSASVTNSGTSSAAVFNFTIPRGDAGQSGPPGNAGPQGNPGTAASVAAGTTTTSAPGTAASVTNAGSSTAAVFNFTIPRGDVGQSGPPGNAGPQGNAGTAATIAAGTTTTGAPGTAASVTNAGSSTAAVFNFTIPRGDPGADLSGRKITGAMSVAGGGDLTADRTLSLVGDLASVARGRYYGTNGSGALGYQDLAASVTPTIWAVRLRSYNAIGNCSFEIDQRNVGTVLANPAGGTFLCDRWALSKTGSMTLNTQRQVTSSVVAPPGTNFRLTTNILLIQLQTQQTTLAAGDFLWVLQSVEGPRWRELMGDVHSISLLVNSTVAPLKFSIALRDTPSSAKSLVKLCTIPTANTWTLIPLPNLPVWPAGNFTSATGAVGYQVGVTLAAGSTFTAPAADTWQSGNFIGAPGMDNFAALPVGTNLYLGFVQHEPGSQCTTLIDCPWQQNYEDCLRYYAKSYDYATKAGTVSANGNVQGLTPANLSPYFYAAFKKAMAKVPTLIGYSPSTGAANNIRDWTSNTERAISSVISAGETGFCGFNLSSPNTVIANQAFHYTADTGW